MWLLPKGGYHKSGERNTSQTQKIWGKKERIPTHPRDIASLGRVLGHKDCGANVDLCRWHRYGAVQWCKKNACSWACSRSGRCALEEAGSGEVKSSASLSITINRKTTGTFKLLFWEALVARLGAGKRPVSSRLTTGQMERVNVIPGSKILQRPHPYFNLLCTHTQAPIEKEVSRGQVWG